MGEERFRPFFFPEWGWLLIVASGWALWEIGNGTALRNIKRKMVQGAPLRLLVGSWAVVALGTVIGGVGLVLESEKVALVGLSIAVPAILLVGGLSYWYAIPKEREHFWKESTDEEDSAAESDDKRSRRNG